MAQQKRIIELARKYKVSSSALMQLLKQLKIPVKSHMSYVDDETEKKIHKMFEIQKKSEKVRQKKRKQYRKKRIAAKLHKKELAKKKKEKQKKLKKSKSAQGKPKKKKDSKKRDKYKPSKSAKKKKKSTKAAPVKKKKQPPKPKFKSTKAKAIEEKRKKFFDEEEAKNRIKATLSKKTQRKKHKKRTQKETPKKKEKIVVREFTSASELAKLMDENPTVIVAKFMELGQMITINQRLDKESLIMICDEFNFDVDFAEQHGVDTLHEQTKVLDEVKKETRPPVVSVLGHVDHGKTSVLDYIREANVIAGEKGGITQHIGAYQVNFNDRDITFIDTPGHEAFTAMRARGAELTDIAIIVIAADDGVMPQTMEAIDHAKSAEIPMIIAINKMDLPAADPEKVKRGLAKKNIMVQGWGGEIECVECSAKTGDGIKELLDTILLVGEMEELKGRFEKKAEGVVIEAKLDKGKGPVSTVLIKNGVLRKKDIILCGAQYGNVRLMLNERQKSVDECSVSGVVQILGLNGVPAAGDILNVVEDEATAKKISEKRQFEIRQRQLASGKGVTLDNLFDKIQESEIAQLNVIVKADTDGSVEAICDALEKTEYKEVGVNIIHRAVGGIVEADVDLASAAEAIIIGFHIRPNTEARRAAEKENVEIRLYEIIFEVIDDVKKSLEGLLSPVIKDKYLGSAEVLQIFKISKIGTVAGCRVDKGKITNDSLLRLYRDDIKIYEGAVSTLKRFQNDASSVTEGKECGIGIENYNNIQVGDVIEAYTQIKERKKLE